MTAQLPPGPPATESTERLARDDRENATRCGSGQKGVAQAAFGGEHQQTQATKGESEKRKKEHGGSRMPDGSPASNQLQGAISDSAWSGRC